MYAYYVYFELQTSMYCVQIVCPIIIIPHTCDNTIKHWYHSLPWLELNIVPREGIHAMYECSSGKSNIENVLLYYNRLIFEIRYNKFSFGLIGLLSLVYLFCTICNLHYFNIWLHSLKLCQFREFLKIWTAFEVVLCD